jgi:hypothetical protein
VVVGGEGAGDGLAGVVVVPDGGGQGEEPLQDSDQDALGAVAVVAFRAELGLEGGVDRLADLAQGLGWRVPRRGASTAIRAVPMVRGTMPTTSVVRRRDHGPMSSGLQVANPRPVSDGTWRLEVRHRGWTREGQRARAARSSWRRRSGSASTSIWVIFPSWTVKARRETGRPCWVVRRPAFPLTSTGVTSWRGWE